MSLTLVATPIGNPDDITLRAIETLKNAEVIIGEEYREMTTLLKGLGIPRPDLFLLNEHTSPSEIADLITKCENQRVALVTDCGTPGFCDPGADLVAACRERNILVTSAPGACSLTTLLSLSGARVSSFVFLGFLPAESGARKEALQQLKNERRTVVLMDTPYRLNKLIRELEQTLDRNRQVILGLNLTTEGEKILNKPLKELASITFEKSEFVLMLPCR